MIRKEPALVVLAAGMGSRYGGLKQLDAVGPDGEILMDYSVYDAVRAGFREVIFIIRKDFADAFEEQVGRKLKGRVAYRCVFQDADDLPEGFSKPEGRTKPWGTGHAVLAARGAIEGPFAVINADDYYGRASYKAMYRFLCEADENADRPVYSMCVWRLRNTLSEFGQVSRGVLSTDEKGNLTRIREIKRIERCGDGGRFSTDGGKTYAFLDGDVFVSMNFWGFPKSFIDVLGVRFPAFLRQAENSGNLTAEYLLPEIVGEAHAEGAVDVHLMPVDDTWFGVTFREDKPRVAAAFRELAEQGVYPSPLWGNSENIGG